MIPRWHYLVIAILGVLLAAWIFLGCTRMRCQVRQVPITMVDGTTTIWPLEICQARW